MAMIGNVSPRSWVMPFRRPGHWLDHGGSAIQCAYRIGISRVKLVCSLSIFIDYNLYKFDIIPLIVCFLSHIYNK